MNVKVLENEDTKLKIEVDDLTLVNLVNENIWEQKGVEVSAYAMEHPYLSQPVLTVRAKNPKKALLDACQQAADDAKDLRKQAQAAFK